MFEQFESAMKDTKKWFLAGIWEPSLLTIYDFFSDNWHHNLFVTEAILCPWRDPNDHHLILLIRSRDGGIGGGQIMLPTFLLAPPIFWPFHTCSEIEKDEFQACHWKYSKISIKMPDLLAVFQCFSPMCDAAASVAALRRWLCGLRTLSRQSAARC